LVLNGCAVLAAGVIVVEIVDHFLGPHGGRLRQDILVQRGADPGIGAVSTSIEKVETGASRTILKRIFGEVA
jgi:hypothetical protein